MFSWLKFNHMDQGSTMADFIKQAITVNEYKVGEKLPSINFLSENIMYRATRFSRF